MSSRRDSLRTKPAKVAYIQETDDSGNAIEGTETYASSVAPSSPSKERMNTGKKKSRRGESSPANGQTDSDSTTVHQPIRGDGDRRPRDKGKERAPGVKKVTLAARPSPKHARTSPVPTSYPP